MSAPQTKNGRDKYIDAVIRFRNTWNKYADKESTAKDILKSQGSGIDEILWRHQPPNGTYRNSIHRPFLLIMGINLNDDHSVVQRATPSEIEIAFAQQGGTVQHEFRMSEFWPWLYGRTMQHHPHMQNLCIFGLTASDTTLTTPTLLNRVVELSDAMHATWMELGDTEPADAAVYQANEGHNVWKQDLTRYLDGDHSVRVLQSLLLSSQIGRHVTALLGEQKIEVQQFGMIRTQTIDEMDSNSLYVDTGGVANRCMCPSNHVQGCHIMSHNVM